MSKKITVAIEETVAKEFTIEVPDDDKRSLVDIAIEKYKNGELVLDPGEVQYRKVAILEPVHTIWTTF